PFQLQFMNSYARLTQAHDFAQKKLDEWFLESEKKGEARSVLNHGEPIPAHFVQARDGTPYWLSFEKSFRATPVLDIQAFLSHSLYTYPTEAEDRFQWYTEYHTTFPLTFSEKRFMMSHLVYPKGIYKLIDGYNSVRREFQELELVMNMQEETWFGHNVEQFIRHIQQDEYEVEMREFQSRGEEEE
ncbi:MAG: hypothetical protein ACRCWQ_11190, partial [Bacilli bacterium]